MAPGIHWKHSALQFPVYALQILSQLRCVLKFGEWPISFRKVTAPYTLAWKTTPSRSVCLKASRMFIEGGRHSVASKRGDRCETGHRLRNGQHGRCFRDFRCQHDSAAGHLLAFRVRHCGPTTPGTSHLEKSHQGAQLTPARRPYVAMRPELGVVF